MGMAIGSGKGGILSEVNVVPLIDILLVLLVIFMIIPHRQMGLQASLPQTVSSPVPEDAPEPIIVQIAADGTVRINGSEVKLDELRDRLERIFALRARRVAFLQGDRSLEFQAVAQVLDLMHVAGVSPVGLLSSELEKNR
ncbi:MAG TPA: biopolymer transporter ExbD [Candidatus Sulfotelmatobacter sp.]|nr:biopolymer transporter ExbD [Candidatus Sulfotelmatobacter sp.]